MNKKRLGLPMPWEHPAVAGIHVVSMTRGYSDGVSKSIATCQCGWTSSVEIACHVEQDLAVLNHWQSVIDDDIASKRKRRAA